MIADIIFVALVVCTCFLGFICGPAIAVCMVRENIKDNRIKKARKAAKLNIKLLYKYSKYWR